MKAAGGLALSSLRTVVALHPKIPGEEQAQPSWAQGRVMRAGKGGLEGTAARLSPRPGLKAGQGRCFPGAALQGRRFSYLSPSPPARRSDDERCRRLVQTLPKAGSAPNTPLVLTKRVCPHARDGEGNHQAPPRWLLLRLFFPRCPGTKGGSSSPQLKQLCFLLPPPGAEGSN